MARAPKAPEPGRRKKSNVDRASADAASSGKSGPNKPAPRTSGGASAGRSRSPFPAPPRPQPRSDARGAAEGGATPGRPATQASPARPPAARPPAARASSARSPMVRPAAPPPAALAGTAAPAHASIAQTGGAARIARGFGLLAELARVNLNGWGGILRDGLRVALGGFARVNLVQLLFAAACCAVFVTALARWLQYDITLLSLETVASGSRSRFWFILPALLGIAFVGLDLPFRRLVFYISAAAAGALYAAGFVFPDPIHTKMLKYEFTPWIYAYGAALAAAASLAGGGLSRALIEKEALRNFLFSRPAD